MGNYLNILFRSPKIYSTELESSLQKNHSSCNRIHHMKRTMVDEDRGLRLKILDDISIHFLQPVLILLFAPPDYGIESIAQYISHRVNLPILKAPILSELSPTTIQSFQTSFDYHDRGGYDQSDIQLMTELEILLTSSTYANGCIMYDYPTSPKHYRFLCEIYNVQQIPFFFDMDPQVIRLLVMLTCLVACEIFNQQIR